MRRLALPKRIEDLVEVRKGIAKVAHKRLNFGLCCCGWQAVGSAPDDKSLHDVANG